MLSPFHNRVRPLILILAETRCKKRGRKALHWGGGSGHRRGQARHHTQEGPDAGVCVQGEGPDAGGCVQEERPAV